MERHKELKKQNTAIPESQGAVLNLSLRQGMPFLKASIKAGH